MATVIRADGPEKDGFVCEKILSCASSASNILAEEFVARRVLGSIIYSMYSQYRCELVLTQNLSDCL